MEIESKKIQQLLGKRRRGTKKLWRNDKGASAQFQHKKRKRVRRWVRLYQATLARKAPCLKGHPDAPIMSKQDFLVGIKDTGGIHKAIAQNLDISVYRVRELMTRPGWEDVKALVDQERSLVIEDAEMTVRFLINQRNDLRVAGANATWLLERLKPDTYAGPAKRVVMDGTVSHQHTHLDLTTLLDQMSLEMKTKLLELMEQQGLNEQALLPEFVEPAL